MRRLLAAILMLVILVVPVSAQTDVREVFPRIETVPTPTGGANGVAIWLHPTDLSQSVLIGADSTRGIGVYTLDGAELQFLTDAPINNVDLRYNFPLLDEGDVTLVAGNVSDEPLVYFWTVDTTARTLQPLATLEPGIATVGLCLYQSAITRRFYVFVNDEDGAVEQYWVQPDGRGGLTTQLARDFNVGSETEGCVADDELGQLYIAEEEVALWRYGAEPESGTRRRVIDQVGGGGNISEQIEGLTLLYGADGAGYLIGSNEQSNSFLVYERGGENAFVGEFSVEETEVDGQIIDGVQEQNGLDVIGLPVNDLFPDGLFVTSDDSNTDPLVDNNFKLVSLGDIASALELPLDASFDPRRPLARGNTDVVLIPATAETQPVPSQSDAADDPSIWIHPTDTALSTIIGTDKRGGLVVYDLNGEELQYVPEGRVNNVDLRYNFPLGGERVAIVATSNRTTNTVDLFVIDDETRLLSDAPGENIAAQMLEVYGLCLYVSPNTGDYYVFVNGTNTGDVEQYRLYDDGTGQIAYELVRQWMMGAQTEGCAADDETGLLYLGVESEGFYRFNAEPDGGDERVQVDNTTVRGNLTEDVEGIAIYYGPNGTGYLVVSSQGSDTFVLYDRQGDNAYIGTFGIIESEAADAVSTTDGLDVTNFPLGSAYPNGVLVVQDDLNIQPDQTQNFKFVDWALIAEAFDLMVDTTFDPRAVGAE